MAPSLLGLSLVTVFLIILISFIFDLMDLGCEEEIRSYRFVFSTVYGIYLIFRVFFGLAAALILKSTELVDDPLLLSLFSVFASSSILQNFALKIGGTQPINMHELFQNYRDRLVVVVGQKEEKKLRKKKLQAETRLAKMGDKELRQILTLLIADMVKKEEWKRMKQEYLEYADDVSEGDEETRRFVLAKIIASLDPLYVDVILEEQRKPEVRADQ